MHSRATIQKYADEARRKHWPGGELPIDIDIILERLGIDIIPVANLRKDVGVEACISADLSSIYLDLEYARDERMNSRVRFSLAHEFGHIILHPHVFQAIRAHGIVSVLDWAKHIQDRIDTLLLERESNEFAGCFLVPEADLRKRYDQLFPNVRERLLRGGMDPDTLTPDTLYSYMANAICRDFDVSAAVIAIRLDRINARHSIGGSST